MLPENKINEFVSRLRQAAGSNLRTVLLYGSGATGAYDPKFSDLNLFCLLHDASWPALRPLATLVEWWSKQNPRAPLFMSTQELERSADVFSIELLDIQAEHEVLFGDNPLAHLHIPMTLHRAQVEYELREKLIMLRHYLLLASGKPKATWDLLLRSVPAFSTLFRHALMAAGEPARLAKRESIQKLARHLGVDAAGFLDVLEVREGRKDKKDFHVHDAAARYLAVVEQVTAAVDRMLDSPGPLGP